MINYIYTILGNRAAADYVSRVWPVAPVYIDPGFVPTELPGSLAAIDRILFGADPDPTMLSYCLGHYLRAASRHPTVQLPSMSGVDTRTLRLHDFTDARYVPGCYWTSDDANFETPALLRSGDLPDARITGRCEYGWKMERLSETEGTVTDLVIPGEPLLVSQTEEVPLAGIPYSVTLESLPVGKEVRLLVHNLPKLDLGYVGRAIEGLPADTVNDLLPFSYLVEQWETCDSVYKRVILFILMYIYRLHTLYEARNAV